MGHQGDVFAGSVVVFIRCLCSYVPLVETNEAIGKVLHFHIGFLICLEPQGQSHPIFFSNKQHLCDLHLHGDIVCPV